jgi:hypothetical protein
MLFRRTLASSLALFSLVALGACGAPPSDTATEATSSAGQALAPDGVKYFAWSQYDSGGGTVMMNVQNGFCFLTGVTGNFRGEGEGVWIDQVTYASNNTYWRLQGKSGQQSVSARAQCVPFSAIRGPNGHSWSNFYYQQAVGRDDTNGWDQSSETMWGTDSYCYMTGLGGKFDGSHEDVGVYHYSNTLHVNTLAHAIIWSEAVCMSPQGGSWEFAQGGNLRGQPDTLDTRVFQWSYGQPFVQLPNSDKAYCFLTDVSGNFGDNGGGNHVDIYHNADDTQWLGGSSTIVGGEAVQAQAQCVYYDQRSVKTADSIVGTSGLCVDVAGINPANGTPTQLWGCWGGDNQRWIMPNNTNSEVRGLDGKCLDIQFYDANNPSTLPPNGTAVGLYDCWGGPNQHWTLTAGAELRMAGTNKCLQARSNGKTNGTPLEIWDCNGTSQQQWSVNGSKIPITIVHIGLGN